MDWFLYDRDHRHERVNNEYVVLTFWNETYLKGRIQNNDDNDNNKVNKKKTKIKKNKWFWIVKSNRYKNYEKLTLKYCLNKKQ